MSGSNAKRRVRGAVDAYPRDGGAEGLQPGLGVNTAAVQASEAGVGQVVRAKLHHESGATGGAGAAAVRRTSLRVIQGAVRSNAGRSTVLIVRAPAVHGPRSAIPRHTASRWSAGGPTVATT